MTKNKRNNKKDIIFWMIIVALVGIGLYLIVNPIYVRERRKSLTKDLNTQIQLFNETAKMPAEAPKFIATKPKSENNSYSPKEDEHDADDLTFVSEEPLTESTDSIQIEDIPARTYPTIVVDPNDNPFEEEEVWIRGNEVFQQTVRAVYHGDYVITVIGQIQIPEINLDLPVLDNAAHVSIRYGPGRYADTQEIGDIGNTVVFGHRTRYANDMFHEINHLSEGSEIYIHKDGLTYKYQVTKQDIISPTQIYDYMFDEPTDRNQLILATCDPVPTWENYMLVYADLVEVTPFIGSLY